jgi:hypothetical protein
MKTTIATIAMLCLTGASYAAQLSEMPTMPEWAWVPGSDSDPESWATTPIDWTSSVRYAAPSGTKEQNGAVSNQLRQVIQVAAGLNYIDSSGLWKPSQNRLQFLQDGSAAFLEGPNKVYFGPVLGDTDARAITVVTRSNVVLKTRPIGIYYFDLASGKEVLLAPLAASTAATAVATNRFLYKGAFASEILRADFQVTCTKAGIECDTVLTSKPKGEPSAYGLNPSTTLLQVRHFCDKSAEPTVQIHDGRATGIQDENISFGDTLFAPGKAFTVSMPSGTTSDAPAQLSPITCVPSDEFIPVAKAWTSGEPAVLSESLMYTNVAIQLAALPNTAKTSAERGKWGETIELPQDLMKATDSDAKLLASTVPQKHLL